MKPRPSTLKSGSRAQQAPDGVHVGFASAGSLWKLNALENENQDSLERARTETAKESFVEETKTSTGKLVKPKKTAPKQHRDSSNTEQKLGEYAYLEADEPKRKKAKTVAVTKSVQKTKNDPIPPPAPSRKPQINLVEYTLESRNGPNVVGNAVETFKPKKACRTAGKGNNISARKESGDSVLQSPSSYKPTLSFVEYALESKAGPDSIGSAAQQPKPMPKKPRKNAAKASDAAVEPSIKKPRKRKMKSESIILNSDEPEPNIETTIANEYFVQAQYERVGLEHSKDGSKTGNLDTVQLEAKPDESATIMSAATKPPERLIVPVTDNAELPAIPVLRSTYFAKSPHKYGQIERPLAAALVERDTGSPCELEEVVSPIVSLAAPSRRRDWTPVKQSANLVPPYQRPRTAESEGSETFCEPRRQLSDVLGSFGYVPAVTKAVVSERNATAEVVTKKRKIELGHSVGITVGSRVDDKAQAGTVPKPIKQKKERKKAQTITALATAAFQPPTKDDADEGAVSPFFSPHRGDAPNQVVPVEQPKPTVTKPRRPRKPKDQTKNAGGQKASTKPRKQAKAKPAKVNFNEAEYRSRLYSPDRATAQMKNQDFLFGTSSQLALDEGAEFIRDLQAAVQRSELHPRPKLDDAPASSQALLSQAQQSPQATSCTRVPTAPHGTCLSIEQARREMWCAPSRDFDGAIFKCETGAATKATEVAQRKIEVRADPRADQSLSVSPQGHGTEHFRPQSERVEIDLCATSPIEAQQDMPQEAFTNAEWAPLDAEHEIGMPTSGPNARGRPGDDDERMLFQGSNPPPAAQLSVAVKAQAQRYTEPMFGASKVLSPRRFRPPLSPLNPNVMMFIDLPSGNQFAPSQGRGFSSAIVDQTRKPQSPTGRGPGRPRKEATVESLRPNPPKRRGRPPKLKSLASDPSPQVPKAEKGRTGFAASQPIEQSVYIDIDDIYDSDSPATPSPARRRARSSPTAMQPLPLSPSRSPSLKAKAPGVVALSAATCIKADHPNWTSMRTDVFSRITAVVKSAPRSTDPGRPSWWEKILLYDPIVLEDLTAWLNAQGLRVEVKRVKHKAKKKGRKTKDAVVEEEVEWEEQQEPVQAWMVQKWCEEKSVCCLWKEGLRGGVRTRY